MDTNKTQSTEEENEPHVNLNASDGTTKFEPSSSTTIRGKRSLEQGSSPPPEPPTQRIKHNAYSPQGINDMATQHMFESQIFKIREMKRMESLLRNQIQQLQQKQSLISSAFSLIGRAWAELNHEFDIILPASFSNSKLGSTNKNNAKNGTKGDSIDSSDIDSISTGLDSIDLFSQIVDRTTNSPFIFPFPDIDTKNLPQIAIDPIQLEAGAIQSSATTKSASLSKQASSDPLGKKQLQEEEEETNSEPNSFNYSLDDISGLDMILLPDQINIPILEKTLKTAVQYTSSLLNKVVSSVNALKSQNDKILSLLEDAAAKPKGLNKKTASIVDDLTFTRKQLQNLQTTFDNIKETNVQLSQDNTILSDKFIYSLQAVKAVNQAISWLKEDLQTEKSTCDRLRNTNTILDSELRSARKEIKDLQTSVKAGEQVKKTSIPTTKTSSSPSTQPLDIEDIVHLPLEEQIQHFQFLLEIRQQEIKTLEKRSNDFAHRLSKKNQDHNRILSDLKLNQVQKSAAYISLKNEHSKCSAKIQSLQTQLQQGKNNLSSYKQTSTARIEDLETRMQQQLQVWSDKRSTTQKELKNALETVDGFKSRLEQAQNAYRGREKMAKTISEMTESFSSLIKKFEQVTQEQRQVITQRTEPLIVSSEEEISSLAKACDDLSEQLEQTIQQLVASQQANADLNTKLAKQQDVWDNLVHERMKSDQYHSKLSQQHSAIKNQLESLTAVDDQIKAINVQLEKKIEFLNKKIANFEAAEVISSTLHSELESEKAKLEEQMKILKGKVESLTQAWKKSEKSVSTKLTQIQKLHSSLNQTREQNALFKKKYASLRANGGEEIERELEEYKSKLTCSLCSLRHKSTALKTCGHLFCSECMQSRIAARNRKCPGCMQSFAKSDLVTLFFDEGTNQED